uniref:Ribosomal protein S19 n=1 Tax=Cyanoptyche gloeocystis TaxID=77922 RepID=A0A096Y6W0_9EUKA|nr:ribosomal protein S19 [Cyanoptyche gloeocystis]AIM52071.1 ribosomal protein S19 [Cyanoptyche gloeocystis]
MTRSSWKIKYLIEEQKKNIIWKKFKYIKESNITLHLYNGKAVQKVFLNDTPNLKINSFCLKKKPVIHKKKNVIKKKK